MSDPIAPPSPSPSRATKSKRPLSGTRLRARREQHQGAKRATATAAAKASGHAGDAPALGGAAEGAAGATEEAGTQGDDEETRLWKRVCMRHHTPGCYPNGVWVEHTDHDQAPTRDRVYRNNAVIPVPPGHMCIY